MAFLVITRDLRTAVTSGLIGPPGSGTGAVSRVSASTIGIRTPRPNTVSGRLATASGLFSSGSRSVSKRMSLEAVLASTTAAARSGTCSG
ncbi:Uncharacterised protein [Mycobacteroides abscessus subsp. abscessus]|nr:Uncharacterised protein [Mycobacteroides abscessus subsp. abscessus]